MISITIASMTQNLCQGKGDYLFNIQNFIHKKKPQRELRLFKLI